MRTPRIIKNQYLRYYGNICKKKKTYYFSVFIRRILRPSVARVTFLNCYHLVCRKKPGRTCALWHYRVDVLEFFILFSNFSRVRLFTLFDNCRIEIHTPAIRATCTRFNNVKSNMLAWRVRVLIEKSSKKNKKKIRQQLRLQWLARWK